MGKISLTKLELVKKLYYEKQLSMKEIARVLGVSIDAVCYFMRHNELPRRSFSEISKIVFANKSPSFRLKNLKSVRNENLKTVGVILYWCEGYKTNKSHGIDFANSDSEMISIFMKFLRKICGIDEKRLRVLLYCYSNQNPEKLTGYWSKLTKIPKKQFSRPYVRKDFQIAKSSKMPYGLVHIRYMDKKLLNLMREWISEYKGKYA